MGDLTGTMMGQRLAAAAVSPYSTVPFQDNPEERKALIDEHVTNLSKWIDAQPAVDFDKLARPQLAALEAAPTTPRPSAMAAFATAFGSPQIGTRMVMDRVAQADASETAKQTRLMQFKDHLLDLNVGEAMAARDFKKALQLTAQKEVLADKLASIAKAAEWDRDELVKQRDFSRQLELSHQKGLDRLDVVRQQVNGRIAAIREAAVARAGLTGMKLDMDIAKRMDGVVNLANSNYIHSAISLENDTKQTGVSHAQEIAQLEAAATRSIDEATTKAYAEQIKRDADREKLRSAGKPVGAAPDRVTVTAPAQRAPQTAPARATGKLFDIDDKSAKDIFGKTY